MNRAGFPKNADLRGKNHYASCTSPPTDNSRRGRLIKINLVRMNQLSFQSLFNKFANKFTVKLVEQHEPSAVYVLETICSPDLFYQGWIDITLNSLDN